jgi:serine/threonine protein kinase
MGLSGFWASRVTFTLRTCTDLQLRPAFLAILVCMREPTNPGSGRTLSETVADSQRTIALSEVPDAASPSASGSNTPIVTAPTIGDPSLSTAALAALGQRYDILGDAGHGSMGDVYKARDRETGEIVALKLLRPEIASDQAMMDRFKNELLFARKITHKNVCRVYEFNRVGGVAYTSMEFVEGESLRSVLNRFGALSQRKATDLALQICSGLKEAHAQGIVHRDLKPENVMIDTRGNVKVMDFGIARSMEALTRLTGAMVGTPAYMAPEQVEGKPVDYRTDIYSLGLILFEVFTGTQAFRADNAVAVALKQMRETPPLPSSIEPTIPAPAERAILKCLEKDPAKRYQSMADLENALRVPEAGASAATTSYAPPATPARLSNSVSPVVDPYQQLKSASKRRISPVIWILAAVLVVLAVFAGKQGRMNARLDGIPPRLPQALVPVPPDFALEKTPPPAAAAIPDDSESLSSESSKSVTDAAKIVAPAVATTLTQKAAAVQPEAKPAKSASDQLPVTPPSAALPPQATNAPNPAAAPADDRTPYLLVGRYQREDRAQESAKKIEDLGLPVVVLPRQNPNGSNFFIVLSGPFAQNHVQSALQQLRTAGFLTVHPVKNSLVTQGATP